MRFSRLVIGASALAVSMLFVRSAIAGEISYTGYSSDGTGGTPYINGSPIPASDTAAAERNNFLGLLHNNYYYEDFQEVGGFRKSGGGTSSVAPIGYSFQWKSNGVPVGSAPAGTLSTDVAGTGADVTFHQGPDGNARGAFDYDDPFDSSVGTGTLAAAVPNTSLADSSNNFVDILPDKTLGTYDLTISITPGENAVGLMLNDVVQPNKTDVIVTFIDGTSTTVQADDINGFKLNTHGKLVSADLANNNDWFLGIIGADLIDSVTIEEASNGTPITLDNVYVGEALGPAGGPITVPLPASAIGGSILLGALAIRRRRFS